MTDSYKVFTVASGKVTPGAVVGILQLKGAGISIPAIMVGEEGRGRSRGVLPVGNPPMVPCPDQGIELWTSATECPRCGAKLGDRVEGTGRRLHPASGQVSGRLMFAEVTTTKAGKPKLFARPEATTDEKVVVILETGMGYRGGNSHTGDRAGWKCSRYGCEVKGEGVVEPPAACPKCGASGWDGPRMEFAPFPGEVLISGNIAQGAAGRMGSGEQLVALIPKGAVFRTAYSGRLYGGPDSHYYKWDGQKFLAATWEERAAADLF